MAVIGTPVDSTWVNPSSVQLTGAELRRADAALFAGNGTGLGVHGGIVRHGGASLQVTVNGSDVVTVQPGACVIPGNATAVGCYRTSLGAAVTGSLTARDATNGRIDLVVFHQLDIDVVSTSGGYQAQVETITGTPSATPVSPVMPSQAIELARINVPRVGGGAATVDSSFAAYAAALGGTIPVTSSDQLPSIASKGQRAIALDTFDEFIWNGSSWMTQPKPIQFASGTFTLSDGGSNPSTRTITFPVGTFTSAPNVQVTPQTGGGSATISNYAVTSVSSTSFTVGLNRNGTTSVTFAWLALNQP